MSLQDVCQALKAGQDAGRLPELTEEADVQAMLEALSYDSLNVSAQAALGHVVTSQLAKAQWRGSAVAPVASLANAPGQGSRESAVALAVEAVSLGPASILLQC